MTNETKSAITCTTLLLATVYVTALQIYWGMAPYYGYDELWHTALAAVSPPWLSLLLISADVHPPLHYLLLRPLTRIGSDPFFPRLLAIVPTIFSLPLWYFLLRKLRVNSALALTSTVVLAIAFSFHHVGIMVRSYSLAMLFLFSAVWFWIDMLPGSRSQPSRWSAVLSLVLFTAAFWTLYAAVFVTTAVLGSTILVMLLDKRNRRSSLALWRTYSAWPEWLAFFLFHLLAIAWMWLGWKNHGNTSITNHINPFLPAPDQNILEYLAIGLRRELALFSPLFKAGNTVLNIGLCALWAVIFWLTTHNIRRGNTASAVLALTPLLITALLALAGSLYIYPFGGSLRHQYVLFPFLLLLLPLLLNAFWNRLPNAVIKGLLIAAVLALTVHTTTKTHGENFYIGDAPPTPFWNEEFKVLFGKGSDSVIVTPAYGSYATFMNRWIPGVHYRTSYQCSGRECSTAPQGFSAIIKPWPDFMEFAANTDDGGKVLFLRYRQAMLPTLPDAVFFNKLRGTLEAMGKIEARLFSPETNHQPNQDREALRRTTAKHGFTLTEFQPINTSVIWSVEVTPRTPDSEATPSRKPSPEPE